MADIYLATSRDQLGGTRYVVIKEILPHLSRDAGFADMLVAEAKLAAQLNHANVVQVIDLGRERDRLYIAMEYVEGFDLNQLLRRLSKARIPIPAEYALYIVREMLRALDYAHRKRGAGGEKLGIVHRDVSPSNVLVSFEGEVKLCDFGIARAFNAADTQIDESRIAETRVAGKSAYMAPEHARGDELDARADVFAAGILLWELSAGRRLYKGTEEQMLEMARAGEVPPLPEGRLPSQEALQAVLDRTLAKEPSERFSSAAEMLAALEDYAMEARLMASQLRFATFLTEHFAEEIVDVRRERERQAEYLLERDPSGSSVRPIIERRPEDPRALRDEDEGLDEVALASPPHELRDTMETPAAPLVDAGREREVAERTSSPSTALGVDAELAAAETAKHAAIAAERALVPWLVASAIVIVAAVGVALFLAL
jgi:serine/threonine-protein kinase